MVRRLTQLLFWSWKTIETAKCFYSKTCAFYVPWKSQNQHWHTLLAQVNSPLFVALAIFILLVILRCMFLDKKMDWTHRIQSIYGTVNKTHVIHPFFSSKKVDFSFKIRYNKRSWWFPLTMANLIGQCGWLFQDLCFWLPLEMEVPFLFGCFYLFLIILIAYVVVKRKRKPTKNCTVFLPDFCQKYFSFF